MPFQNQRNVNQKIINSWREWVDRQVFGLPTTIAIAGLIVAILALWGFIELADEVLEKQTKAIDQAILLAIKPLHTPLLNIVMHGFSIVGGTVVVTLLCLGLGVTFWVRRNKIEFTTLAIAALGSVIMNLAIKLFFKRDRPALWELVSSNPRTSSFPSGHAMMSLVIYGLLGYLLAHRFPRWRWWIFIGITLLVTAIGFSRLYLGIHWPTDIVAGYAAALIWLAVSILYLEVRWKRRSQRQRVKNLSSPSS